MFEQITILGPGLLGASLALAIKEHGLARNTVVWSRRSESRIRCAHQSWCDIVLETPEEAVEKADLTVVCSPVQTIHPLVSRIARRVKCGGLVTDVGSAKSLIARYCHAVMPKGSAFVGSHPMAGSERGGMENARVDLYTHRACFVTPLVDSDPKAVESIMRFWEALDMEVTTVSPEVHDEIVAHISHLPHVVASVLCSYLATRDPNWRNFAGNGLRDTTRIASGSPDLWKAIIEQNRDEIIRAISGFEDDLQSLKSAIANQQSFEILNILEHGKVYRDRMRPLRDKTSQS